MEIKSEYSVYGKDLLPTAWQNVLFINYGKVNGQSIARVLKTDENTVRAEAARMGLDKIVFDEKWLEYGYISIIRNNWHFLSLKEIAVLLDIPLEKLEKILIEDDFLIVKLGNVKPITPEAAYKPLSSEEIKETEEIKEIVSRLYIGEKAAPFVFDFDCITDGNKPKYTGERVLYNYCALYGDFLLSGDFGAYSDKLLAALSGRGITGLWIQAILADLSYYPFKSCENQDYIRRRSNLAVLCEKALGFGIKIYLYLNEPRAIESSYLDESLRGYTENGFSALCISNRKTADYLTLAVEELCRAVPDLGGIITITMSENLTHCLSHGKTNCPHCQNEKPQLLSATVNNLIAKGARNAGGKIKVIANLWGWSSFMGWTEDMIKDGIDMLDDYIEIMLVSEYGKDIEKGGIKSRVIDYSISNVGPSEISERILRYAKGKKRKIWAKIQLNNSWECSCIPYLPVFDLVAKHLNNLTKIGVDDFMLSWTLGGFPSFGIKLATEYYGHDGVDLKSFYKDLFGKKAAEVANAVSVLCDAFQEFPFSLDVLYFSPHTLGGGEFWAYDKIWSEAAMASFSYDDVGKYTVPFGADIYMRQMEKLIIGFDEAIALLEKADDGSKLLKEMRSFAEAVCLHYQSALNHIEFTLDKEKGFPNTEKTLSILEKETDAVKKIYSLQCKDARIGFEASNHYFYNENTLLLKLINLQMIKRKIRNKRIT